MKTVGINAAKSDLDSLLQWVADGESVQIVEREKVIANLAPAGQNVDWNDSWTRLDEVWGPDALPGKPGSEIVSDGRR